MSRINHRIRQSICLLALAAVFTGPAKALVINVSSTTGWTSTGLAITAGDLLEITATGIITFDSAGRQADPDGLPDGDPAGSPNYLVPTLAGQTLVGRIGASGSLADLSGFLVGSNFSQVVSLTGTLFLGFNDGFVNGSRTGLDSGGVGDNSGSFTATVSAVPVPEPGTLLTFALGLLGLGVMRRRRSRVRKATAPAVLTAASWLLLAGTAGAAPLFSGLGDLAGGSFLSDALGISGDGSTVVGSSTSANGGEAFRWTFADGMVGLGDLPGGIFASGALDVSSDGSVIVGESRGTGVSASTEAFRWTQATGMVGLGAIGGSSSSADGVSNDGTVIVGQSDSGRSYRWTQTGGMVDIGPGVGRAVSGDGSVVVGRTEGAAQAYRWTQGTGLVLLGDLPGGGSLSQAWNVSEDGTVIVGFANSTTQSDNPSSGGEAFRWTQATGMVGLGDLPGGDFKSTSNDVSANGAVIVGEGNSASGRAAFVWDTVNGMRNLKDVLVGEFGLDLTGWTLTQATSVSDDGLVIVGRGLNPDGNTEAWIANLGPDPVPEPGTLLIFALGLAGLGAMRRRAAG